MAVADLPEDAPCLCGCERQHHRLGRRGCKTPACGCDRFELDETWANNDKAEKERVLTAVAEVCEDQAERARVELGQQPVSGRLREVEQERDEAVAKARAAERSRKFATERLEGELAAARQEIERLRAAAPPVELYGYDAWQCDVCGSRYRPNHNHVCGPLKPVRVSIQPRSIS